MKINQKVSKYYIHLYNQKYLKVSTRSFRLVEQPLPTVIGDDAKSVFLMLFPFLSFFELKNLPHTLRALSFAAK